MIFPRQMLSETIDASNSPVTGEKNLRTEQTYSLKHDRVLMSSAVRRHKRYSYD